MSGTDTAARRAELYGLLGKLPDRNGPVTCRVISQEERDGLVIEHLVLDTGCGEDVPAVFTKPAGAEGPLPAVLYAHSHGGFYRHGKRELLEGQVYMQRPGYAWDLARRGIAALCPDAWCFGERSGRTEGETFRSMLWHGKTLWGAMVYDHLKALDYLVSRPDVDGDRVAALGMSMGSTQAWYLAALDERIRACAEICCLTDFDALEARGALTEHGVYYFLPGLLEHFTTAEICALIAPRPHLAVAGERDLLTPPEGLDRIDAALRKTYGDLGSGENWCLIRYDTTHFETPEMRREILAFLEAQLRG